MPDSLLAFARKGALKGSARFVRRSDPRGLPFNQEFLAWLQQERAHGRRLILCTASDHSIATAIADHLGMFDEIIASNGTTNLAGMRKAEALVQRFGHAGFDYAGNARDDLAVWQCARHTVMVHPSQDVIRRAVSRGPVERVFPRPMIGFTAWRRVLRLHQWLKNILLVVPAVAAHQVTQIETWLSLILAFFSFSLCASAVYITNDLLDLESDRQHPYKHTRPFASGQVPVWVGFALLPSSSGAVLLSPSISAATFCLGS